MNEWINKWTNGRDANKYKPHKPSFGAIWVAMGFCRPTGTNHIYRLNLIFFVQIKICKDVWWSLDRYHLRLWYLLDLFMSNAIWATCTRILLNWSAASADLSLSLSLKWSTWDQIPNLSSKMEAINSKQRKVQTYSKQYNRNEVFLKKSLNMECYAT